MIRYLARRAGHGLLLLFAVSILLFLLFQAAPGDFHGGLYAALVAVGRPTRAEGTARPV